MVQGPKPQGTTPKGTKQNSLITLVLDLKQLKDAEATIQPNIRLRFRIQGLGFGVCGLGVWGLGFRFRIPGVGFRVEGLRFRV